ncbi:diaminopimelate epimerase [Nitriliruptoraceae bacterium ZYF776]|nr:diaminopimelate epimerase [Profundirhabdus halotolerans]
METIKAHGTANDFVVVPDLDDEVALSADLVRALTDRRRGVGGDGVIRIGAAPADQPDADVFMDYRNADGTIVETCGNGVRVTAKVAVDHHLAVPDADGTLRIATRAGTKPVTVHHAADGTVDEVAVDMGPPILTPAEVPFEADDPADAEVVTHELDVDGTALEVGVVSMGNPHVVTLVDDVDAAPVTTLGPRLEHHPRFPAKVNAGFAQVVDRTTIRLRVWERGVGETAACGTGACAAVVALQRRGLLGERVAVHLPGGVLTIAHRPGSSVTMTGPAVEVGRLHLDDAWLAAVAAADGVTENSAP